MPIHDYVIVGAGFAGAATAWALAARGVEDVVLLEQEPTAGRHSSGRSACFVREHADDAPWQDLCRDGARRLREGALAPYEATGALLLGLGREDVSRWVPLARGRAKWCPQEIPAIPWVGGGWASPHTVCPQNMGCTPQRKQTPSAKRGVSGAFDFDRRMLKRCFGCARSARPWRSASNL